MFVVRRLGPRVKRGPSLVFWPGKISVIQNHRVTVSGKEILIQEKEKEMRNKKTKVNSSFSVSSWKGKDRLKGPRAYPLHYFYAPKAGHVCYIIKNLPSLCLGSWHRVSKTLGISQMTAVSLLFRSPSSYHTWVYADEMTQGGLLGRVRMSGWGLVTTKANHGIRVGNLSQPDL